MQYLLNQEKFQYRLGDQTKLFWENGIVEEIWMELPNTVWGEVLCSMYKSPESRNSLAKSKTYKKSIVAWM